MSDATPAQPATDPAPRPGRPPKIDHRGLTTRDRLLVAATEACVEHGFEAVTMSDVARRAQVSTPAIYNHFASKSDLMVEACRHALTTLDPRRHRPGGNEPEGNGAGANDDGNDELPDPADIVRRYLAPDFADARILQTELHLASLRHPDVRDLLTKWHGDEAARLTSDVVTAPRVKAWFLLLLGLAQLESLSSLTADGVALELEVQRMATALLGQGAGDDQPEART